MPIVSREPLLGKGSIECGDACLSSLLDASLTALVVLDYFI